MSVPKFAEKLAVKFAMGDATEHSYRPALESLFESIAPGVTALNEPRRVACGAPDFVIRSQNIDIGHCEAKDVVVDLGTLKGTNAEQKKRYLHALPNLIYTNGLDFEFYRSGDLVRSIRIGTVVDHKIKLDEDQFDELSHQLREFVTVRPSTITSAKKLATMMAGKAVLIKDILGNSLKADIEQTSELASQYQAVRKHLIHDISIDDFADIYAETIAYGLFAARLHDPTPDTFSRIEALDLLPKSNPFLRSLFGYIAGVDLDDRIRWVIDEIADLFRACNVAALMADFGKLSGRDDPFLHFYETFLAAYNPAKRKARGVWYTPEPVVNFIVRAVNAVLRTEFGLPLGLADTSKITIDWDTGQNATIKKQVHRVQILDPATGTGTFLAEVIKQSSVDVEKVARGAWSTYVEQDLLPRLHGFELLMASYAMCHMKLDMVLTELGYRPSPRPPRLGVYLTNSLEEGEVVTQGLFSKWLADEAKFASDVKQQLPIMCIVGNPPYSGISQNKGDWIVEKIEDYKYVDGQHFGERKHWLHDDYVKFIRLAEHMIEKTGVGVVGMITNNGYLDNPTFRGMRHHLLQTFDRIYVLDLHGNSKKKEKSPDGSADKNVFDIQQGVAILIAVKTTPSATTRSRTKRNKLPLGSVFHSDLWGTREHKYNVLWKETLQAREWSRISTESPYFMFAPSDTGLRSTYDKGVALNVLFPVSCTGIISARDELVIDFDRNAARKKIEQFRDPRLSDATVRQLFFPGRKAGKYQPGDSRGWQLSAARAKLAGREIDRSLTEILYRPFDERVIYYDADMVDWGREEVMRHLVNGRNLALLSPRMTADEYSPLVTSKIISNKTASRYDQTYLFPLYLYPEDGSLETKRRVNIDEKIYSAFVKKAGLRGVDGDEQLVFDYVYGVLHCRSYRRQYAPFLRVDFPRIPLPASPEVFRSVSEKGGVLRRLHLFDLTSIGGTDHQFCGDGSNEVGTVKYTNQRVYINDNQFFDTVPSVAWEFVIGGYQPAQKWLKDRRGRRLAFEEILHYQRIIKVVTETERLSKAIDLPLVATHRPD